MKKTYKTPKARAKGNASRVIIGAIHKGCASSSSRAKKG